jgi:hypothetical protein
MKKKLSTRDRALVSVALAVYEKMAMSTKANLEKLALPTLHIDTAIGNIETIRARLGTTSEEVHFSDDLRITVKDCLSVMMSKAEKVKDGQEELLIPTDETQETQMQIGRLFRAFGDQLDIEAEIGETTVELRSGTKSTGPMSLNEFHRRADKAIKKNGRKPRKTRR